jgi:hypothetical protein
MVVLRNVTSEKFKQLGFKTRKDAISLINERKLNKRGLSFADLKKVIKKIPKAELKKDIQLIQDKKEKGKNTNVKKLKGKEYKC